MSEPNPYASPESAGDPIPEPTDAMFIASIGQRAINDFIDQLLVNFGIYCVGEVLTQQGYSWGEHPYVILVLLEFSVRIGVLLIYFMAMEASCQRTIGKLITGTKVVTAQGTTPTLVQIMIRSLARFIPFDAFSFFRLHPVGWHDSLSGTRVVKLIPSKRDLYLRKRGSVINRQTADDLRGR